MPIDKDGIIKPSKNRKTIKVSIGNICLIITTCISVLSFFTVLFQNHIQKVQYEKEMEELRFEKEKYKNILKESSIQIRSSYIVCHLHYISCLFDDLGENNNVKILSNDITKMFYNSREKRYFSITDYENIDPNAYSKYEYIYPEVVFLKIEVISNRLAQNVNVNLKKISEKENIDEPFRSFSDLRNYDFYKQSKNVNIEIGDVNSNEIILIPVVLKYSEGAYYSNEDVPNIEGESIYKIFYKPENIICYDVLNEKEVVFSIRDVLDDSLITNYFFVEKG